MIRNLNLFFKRVIDIFGSLLGIVILSPLFLIISMTIKFTSRGPIFFKQKRLGKKGKIFKIYKFRTMINGAEKIGTGVFTSGRDDRITKVGKFLRGTSLDELPQLFNIFLGTMSIVGPRPPVTYHPYVYEDYPDTFKDRFKMKPGITGYAQVVGRNTLTWEERFKYDLYYVEKFNIFLDFKIIIKTIFVFASKKQIFDTENKREGGVSDVSRK